MNEYIKLLAVSWLSCLGLFSRSCSSFGFQGRLLFLSLYLAASHLIVVINVAALTLAFGVDGPLARMAAFSRKCTAPILVVAVVAHAHRVQWQFSVRTRRDCALLAA